MTQKKTPRPNLSLSPNTFTKFCWKCEPFSKRRTSASWSTAGSKQIRRSRSRHPDCENLQSSSRKHQRTQKRARRAPSWAPSSAYCDFFLFRCRQAPSKAPSSFILRCRLAPSAAPSSCEEKTWTGLDEHSSPRCENGWTEILQFPSLTLIPYLLSAFSNEIEFLLKNPHSYFTYLREGTQRVFCNFLWQMRKRDMHF